MSTNQETTSAPAATTSTSAVLPAQQTQSSDDVKARSAKAKQISGETFLRLAEKKNTTVGYRINFLKSKGFTAQEIYNCFEAVGQPQSLQHIEDMIRGNTPPLPNPTQPVRQASMYQSPSPYFVPPPVEGSSWKDYFIGITLALVGAFAAYKAACQWLPWEIVFRRKGDTEMPEIEQRRVKKEKRSKEIKIQQTEPPQNEPASTVPHNISENVALSKDTQKLETDLAEKTEQYTKAMKEKAELIVKMAQTKSQQTASARALENANKRIADLEAKLKAEQEATKPKEVAAEAAAQEQPAIQQEAASPPAASADPQGPSDGAPATDGS